MNNPHFTEDEQAEKLKEWWKQNGKSVVAGVIIGLGAIFGVNYWRDYQTTQSEHASLQFEQMLSAEADQSLELGADLLQQYEATPYAGSAALYLAKLHFENGDIEKAEERLRWAMKNGNPQAVKHVARVRLARVLIDKNELQAARDLLASITEYGGFESEYKETLGDIAMYQGDIASARSTYEQAIEALPRGSMFSEMLNIKLDQAIAESKQ